MEIDLLQTVQLNDVSQQNLFVCFGGFSLRCGEGGGGGRGWGGDYCLFGFKVKFVNTNV